MEPFIAGDCRDKRQEKRSSLQGMKEFCKQPYCCVAIIIICLLIMLLGFTGSITYEIYNGKNTTVPKITLNYNISSFNDTLPTNVAIPRTKTMPELAVSHDDDLWIVASEQTGSVSLELASCTDCEKIVFNKSQIMEIHNFMMRCYQPGGCPTQEWPHHIGFTIVCNPVVKMRYSDLHICIDYHRKISSGFIRNFTLNYNALALLNAAENIVNQ